MLPPAASQALLPVGGALASLALSIRLRVAVRQHCEWFTLEYKQPWSESRGCRHGTARRRVCCVSSQSDSPKHYKTIKGEWCCFKLHPCKFQNSEKMDGSSPLAWFSCVLPCLLNLRLPSVLKGSTAVRLPWPPSHRPPWLPGTPGELVSLLSLSRLAQHRVTLPFYKWRSKQFWLSRS